MATRAEVLSDLTRAFPQFILKLDEVSRRETIRVYVRELSDIDPAALEQAARALIRTSEFFPTVRAIRETVAEQTLALPGEAAALEQVYARIAWHRDDEADREGDPPHVHPLVRHALDLVGGYSAFRTADDPGVVRGQFLRLFREARAAAVRDAQTGDLAALPAAPERPALPAA